MSHHPTINLCDEDAYRLDWKTRRGRLREENGERAMEVSHIVVTYRASEAQRTLIRKLLENEGRVSFLAKTPEELREQTLGDARVILTWNLQKELPPAGPRLLARAEMIQLLSAGADHLPFSELKPELVIAGNVGAYAAPMAEHALAMALALAKNLLPEHRNLADGVFHQSGLNRMLAGTLCGIIGFGGIGKATARLMRGIGMRIAAVNTSGWTDEPVEFAGTLSDLERVLKMSDVVVLSLPLTKATRGLIGKKELEWMKSDAILINVARGDIIDQGALYDHLKSHPGFQVGIDVWWTEPFRSGEFRVDYPFFSLPNVLGSPHNSSMVPGSSDEATLLAVENIMRFLRGEKVMGVVKREEYV
jgi:phosphoglycerate dehydrogenase-like enzyme